MTLPQFRPRYERGMIALLFAFSCLCTGMQAQESVVEAADKVDFKTDVARILGDHCVECHNPSLEMAALRLDNQVAAIESGTIDPGDSENSLLIQRLHDKDLGITMPPRGNLTDSDIETLKRWIDQGAEWPEGISLYSVGETSTEDSVAHALFAAIRAGETGSVRRMVERNGYSDQYTDQLGSTPLHQAAWLGNVPTLKYLLSQGADVNAANQIGVTPLMLAIGNLKKTELLLESGANANARSSSGRTPLLLAAAKSNNHAVLKRLIAAGADVGAKDGRNWTALILAARTGDAKMLELLLDAGAVELDAAEIGLVPGTPLTQAVWAGDLASVRLLLDREVGKQEKSLNLSLIVAATHGYEEIVQALVGAGADPDSKEPTGYIPDTPLQAAAYSDHRSLKIVGYLVDQGATIDAAGRKGERAADYAFKRGSKEILALLANHSQASPSEAVQAVEPALSVEIGRQAAIEKSLKLLQACDLPFFNASGCVACHQQSATSLVASMAADRGFEIDHSLAAKRQKLLAFELQRLVPGFMQRHKTGGTAHRIAYLVWGLAASQYAPDTITDAAVYELSGLQLKNGSWVSDAHRPPTEYSRFSATAVSVRAMQDYMPPGLEKQFQRQIKRAREWFETATPRENQELAFRLLGLKWTSASRDMIDEASHQLLALQNEDGGWAQLPQLSSDAYATGLSLYALNVGGDLSTDSQEYEKGLAFLLRTQDSQGAWHVKSRSYGFQPYFESGFPYEHDQWISAAATGWATSALLLSVEQH